MAGRRRITKDAIVEHARRIVAEQGTTGLTFQALAEVLGVSKQAIIYWYQSKWELVQDVALPAIQAEAEVTIEAVSNSQSATEAIERFVRALIGHHLANLSNFRLIYQAMQFDGAGAAVHDSQEILKPIHQTTSSMYGALEAKIASDPGFVSGEHPRRLAVAVHMAAIGLLTMLALADSMDDPMAHSTELLIDSLVALLTGRRSAS